MDTTLQIFGSKASASAVGDFSSGQNNAIFTYPTCTWRCHWEWSHRNLVEIFCIIKLESLGPGHRIRRWLRYRTFARFGTVPTCDGQTDGRTRDDSKYRDTAERCTVIISGTFSIDRGVLYKHLSTNPSQLLLCLSLHNGNVTYGKHLKTSINITTILTPVTAYKQCF